MSRTHRATVLFVLFLCLSLVSLSGLTGVGVVTAQQTETDGSEDVPHRPPSEVNDGGSGGGDDETNRVADWLETRLSSSLANSAAALERGDYEQARGPLGDEYAGYLSRYVEVVEGTDREDDRLIEEYERARTSQAELIDDVEKYEATHEEYRAAREAGNDERARELARELDTLAVSIAEESGSLQERYRFIGENTDTDTAGARESIERTRSDVESTQAEVREDQFVPTELSVSTGSTTASFNDPMTVEGTMTTADGSPVSNEPITVTIGERTVSTTTDGSGSFSVEYRPTTEAIGNTELDVRAVPTESEYDSASTTVDATIERTEPNVEITEASNGAAFGEPFAVRGAVESAGTGVGSIPVVIVVDGERLAEVETDEDGVFDLTTRLPAGVSAGEVDVRAVVALEERAISSTSTTTSVEVAETPGSIDVTAEPRENAIAVRGSLTTEDGTAVGGQPVRVEVNGRTATTVETNEDGTYEALVAIPDDAGARVSIDTVYAEDDSNVGDASASTDVQVGEPTVLDWVSERLGLATLPLDARYLLGAIGFLVIGGGVYLLAVQPGRRNGGTSAPLATDERDGDDSTEGRSNPQAVLLGSARELVRAGDATRAIERAYAAMRQSAGGDGRGETHWEFYRNQARLNDGLSPEENEALQSLTQRFERAAFSTRGASTDDARAAIQEAETIIERA